MSSISGPLNTSVVVGPSAPQEAADPARVKNDPRREAEYQRYALNDARHELADKKADLKKANDNYEDTSDLWYWVLLSVVPLGWPFLLGRGVQAIIGNDNPWPPTPSEGVWSEEVEPAQKAVNKAEEKVARLQAAQGFQSSLIEQVAARRAAAAKLEALDTPEDIEAPTAKTPQEIENMLANSQTRLYQAMADRDSATISSVQAGLNQIEGYTAEMSNGADYADRIAAQRTIIEKSGLLRPSTSWDDIRTALGQIGEDIGAQFRTGDAAIKADKLQNARNLMNQINDEKPAGPVPADIQQRMAQYEAALNAF